MKFKLLSGLVLVATVLLAGCATESTKSSVSGDNSTWCKQYPKSAVCPGN